MTDTVENTESPVEPIPVLTTVPKAKKPPYFVAGDHFFAQSEEGEIKIPLRFKTKLIRTITRGGDTDEAEQLFMLVEGLGDKATSEKLDELDFLDTTEIALRFFQAWEEKNEARLGELRRSSN